MAQKTTSRSDRLKLVTDNINEHTEGYRNSTSIIETDTASVDLRKFYLISALAGKSLMVSSSTGSGKTTFSRAFGKAIFGEDVGFVQIDTGLDENKFRDMIFGRIRDGGSLSSAVEATKAVTAPMVILDEFNRAPAILVSRLQGYLNNDPMNFEGDKQVAPGMVLDDKKSRYQWKVATINEGDAYAGTTRMDKASIDRFGAVIMLDMFPPTDTDKRAIMENGVFKMNHVDFDKDKANRVKDAFFSLYREAKEIPVGTTAREFLLALANKDQCYHSVNGTKASMDALNLDVLCKGCHAAGVADNICGSISAPSIRALEDLKELSKAFVLVTRGESSVKLEVEIPDVMLLANFALYKKMGIDCNWIDRNAHGSSPHATEIAMKGLYTRFIDSWRALKDVARKEADNAYLTSEDKKKIDIAISNDPSCRSREDVIAYMNSLQRSSSGS